MEGAGPLSSPLAGEVSVRSTDGGGMPATPEIPAGTEMVSMTVREAIREAMSEEMRADKDVFLMRSEEHTSELQSQ